MGEATTVTTCTDERTIPRISLRNFEARRAEIKEQLYQAATTEGFFRLGDQAFPSKEDIEEMFELSQEFFALPKEAKMKTPHTKLKNTGYEYMSQIRPSTGVPERKESVQLQLHRINENWPQVEDVGEEWKVKTKEFILKIQRLSILVLELFAEKLGFENDFFTRRHDITADTAQSTLRLLHYFDTTGLNFGPNDWRAGAHTDFDTMTFLFCRDGDNGFEYCPGRESSTSFACGDQWSSAPSQTGEIVVNIGDMLMSWTDDKLKSNFHRVRYPLPGENKKDRYTIGWFNQANTDVVIQGPKRKYSPVTGKEFIENAMRKNFERLSKKTVLKAAGEVGK